MEEVARKALILHLYRISNAAMFYTRDMINITQNAEIYQTICDNVTLIIDFWWLDFLKTFILGAKAKFKTQAWKISCLQLLRVLSKDNTFKILERWTVLSLQTTMLFFTIHVVYL